MDVKRIIEILHEEITTSLKRFPHIINESHEKFSVLKNDLSMTIPGQDEQDAYRRAIYNAFGNGSVLKYQKIDSLKFGGYDKIGFDIEISEPFFNLQEQGEQDCPCIIMKISNIRFGYVDPRTFAKLIFFGLSSDWVFHIPSDKKSRKPRFDVVIAHTEFLNDFYKIKLFL